ncbi:zinc finger protein 84-like isoform X2 [Pectinophora gossypiella]|uniref:zinc finger protein 84-like isoform X2 n=1 Tax=Pectinophora gossypiella TaxID=13191 RepID=UPI00214ECAA4|nr:zinc finger protein 84-like isoform X2 [Pectinophora gossypiella]
MTMDEIEIQENNLSSQVITAPSDSITDNAAQPPQNVNSLFGFKYIPLVASGDTEKHTDENGLTICVFSEDTSYLIVKVAEDDVDSIDNIKKSHLDGIVRKNQMKTGKLPVDLRGPFTCTFPSTLRPDLQCRKIFFNCCEYSLHYREEHTKRRKAALRCQVCEKRLDRDFNASDAIPAQLHTENSFTFSCRLCGLKFPDSFKFDEHNRIVHAKMKPHQCSICFKRFTQQGGLQQHMRMHTGIRPFACTFCTKAFTQKAGLDQHLRTHTKVKPFKCVICSKSFSQSVHLRQHMRTHTNIQPFQCSICGRRFKQSSHLNFHLRSHMSDASSLVVETYAHVQQQDQMEFLNLASLQQVQHGETLYYAAELATQPNNLNNPFEYPTSQPNMPENGLSL